MGLYMNGECNATNVQGKQYNLHKLQGGARAPVPHSWWRHWSDTYIWRMLVLPVLPEVANISGSRADCA